MGGHRSLKEAGEVRKERRDIFRKHFRDRVYIPDCLATSVYLNKEMRKRRELNKIQDSRRMMLPVRDHQVKKVWCFDGLFLIFTIEPVVYPGSNVVWISD